MSLQNELQKRLINWLVKDLFNSIDENDILAFGKRGGVYLKGKKLDIESVMIIKEEADKFSNSTIWKLIEKQVKFAANLRMYNKSLSPEDMIAGKMALFVLKTIRETLNRLAKE